MAKEKQKKTLADNAEGKVQWHPAFYAATKLEFLEYRSFLDYDEEYSLGKMPLQVDLIIKKDDISIKKGIGRNFRKYNLIEYKGPGDALNYQVYHKTIAYAHLYIAQENGELDEEQLFISFVRASKPVKLMRILERKGFSPRKVEEGIYCYEKPNVIAFQIVVLSEMDKQKYRWFTKLRRKLSVSELVDMDRAEHIEGSYYESELMEAVKDAVFRANRELLTKEENMNLRDYFKEEFEEKDRKIEEQSREIEEKDKKIEEKDNIIRKLMEELKSSGKTAMF